MEIINNDTMTNKELEDKKELIPLKNIKELDFLKKYYPPDFFENYKLPKEKLQELIFEVSKYATDLLGPIAVMCAGPKCGLKQNCPLEKKGIAPVGYPCPLEQVAIEQLTIQYVKTLNIDVDNKEEMDKVRELVECDIFDKFRTEAILNKEMTAFQEDAERFDPYSGQVIERKKEIAKAIDVKFKFKKRKDQIMEEFLATRKAKARFQTKREDDPTKKLGNLIGKLEEAEVIEPDLENADKNNIQ